MKLLSPIISLIALGMIQCALAFPPAPHHLFYGQVRDEFGNPLTVTNAEVILESSSGVELKTTVVPNLDPGINYRLTVPMDAGLTSDNYKPTALRPTVPFRIKVRINTAIYLPIEMSGSYSNLGKPAESTLLNLTLGEDSDGDGLPDAWERALIAASGGKGTLQSIKPGDDADGDGLNNLQEYLAGTYAFDPQDGFRLDIVGLQNGNPLMEFLSIKGRSYQLTASTDLTRWTPIPFRVSSVNSSNQPIQTLTASDSRIIRIEAVPIESTSVSRFYKILVQ